MADSTRKVLVVEDYASYAPPDWVIPTIERLLGSLSDGHINGLGAIVLSDAVTAKKRKMRAARRQRHGVFIGRYHRAWKQDRAWIEIVIDLALDRVPARHLDLQFVRDFAVGTVLFHEVGHHLHYTIGSAGRGGESSAEEWEVRLALVHFRKHYRNLRSLREQIRWILGVIARRDAYLFSQKAGSRKK